MRTLLSKVKLFVVFLAVFTAHHTPPCFAWPYDAYGPIAVTNSTRSKHIFLFSDFWNPATRSRMAGVVLDAEGRIVFQGQLSTEFQFEPKDFTMSEGPDELVLLVGRNYYRDAKNTARVSAFRLQAAIPTLAGTWLVDQTNGSVEHVAVDRAGTVFLYFRGVNGLPPAVEARTVSGVLLSRTILEGGGEPAAFGYDPRVRCVYALTTNGMLFGIDAANPSSPRLVRRVDLGRTYRISYRGSNGRSRIATGNGTVAYFNAGTKVAANSGGRAGQLLEFPSEYFFANGDLSAVRAGTLPGLDNIYPFEPLPGNSKLWVSSVLTEDGDRVNSFGEYIPNLPTLIADLEGGRFQQVAAARDNWPVDKSNLQIVPGSSFDATGTKLLYIGRHVSADLNSPPRSFIASIPVMSLFPGHSVNNFGLAQIGTQATITPAPIITLAAMLSPVASATLVASQSPSPVIIPAAPTPTVAAVAPPPQSPTSAFPATVVPAIPVVTAAAPTKLPATPTARPTRLTGRVPLWMRTAWTWVATETKPAKPNPKLKKTAGPKK